MLDVICLKDIITNKHITLDIACSLDDGRCILDANANTLNGLHIHSTKTVVGLPQYHVGFSFVGDGSTLQSRINTQSLELFWYEILENN